MHCRLFTVRVVVLILKLHYHGNSLGDATFMINYYILIDFCKLIREYNESWQSFKKRAELVPTMLYRPPCYQPIRTNSLDRCTTGTINETMDKLFVVQISHVTLPFLKKPLFFCILCIYVMYTLRGLITIKQVISRITVLIWLN